MRKKETEEKKYLKYTVKEANQHDHYREHWRNFLEARSEMCIWDAEYLSWMSILTASLVKDKNGKYCQGTDVLLKCDNEYFCALTDRSPARDELEFDPEKEPSTK